MSIDSYTLCPGGTGKKIKFCCSDLLGDLKTLNRMMEGEQYVAALQKLESIESPGKPRACLLALKIELLQSLEREEDARAVAARFLECFPDNPIALAESAIDKAAVGKDGPAAMQLLQKALSSAGEDLCPQVYDAMSAVAQQMADSGRFRSAHALWQLQTLIETDDRRPQELLAAMSRSDAVPLLIKDEPPLAPFPESSALAGQFKDAVEPLARGHWAEAALRIEKLAQRAPDQSVLWQNLAVVRGWLGDHVGAIAAFQKLAALEVPLEDAVEAAATAMLLSEDPLGDAIDVLRLEFPVENADELAGLFSTWKHADIMPLPPGAFAEDEVPPKMIFWLLSRPTLDPAQDLTLDTAPRILGSAMLFGRQTDREARLVLVGVTSADEEHCVKLLHEVANGRIAGPPHREILGRRSATQLLLHRPWRLPPGTSQETTDSLLKRHLESAVLEKWPGMSLGIVGGRSVAEAAAEPGNKVLVLAAVFVLEDWARQMSESGESVDINRLRSRLGLPELGPIDPEQNPLKNLPLVRLHRVMVEKLSDDDLVHGFHRAVVFGAHEAISVLGRALVDRPEVSAKVRQFALASLASGERDFQRALGYIQRGRALAESQGQSSASWDLNELELRVAHRDAEGASRLFDHLKHHHLREPGVADALRDFLYRAGAIDAHGRPIERESAEDEASEAIEEQPASRLWTPDSEKPAGATSKLWTPDTQ